MALSSPPNTSLGVLVASAVVVSVDPGLTVKILTLNIDVNELESRKVTTTNTNTGDESLKLLNNPRVVLDSFPKVYYTTTNPDGYI